MWIPTVDGCVNSDHVVSIVRGGDGGATLHLVGGQTVRSRMMFYITRKGELEMTDPVEDDEDLPF